MIPLPGVRGAASAPRIRCAEVAAGLEPREGVEDTRPCCEHSVSERLRKHVATELHESPAHEAGVVAFVDQLESVVGEQPPVAPDIRCGATPPPPRSPPSAAL
jgi:hypothetical protein